MKELSVEEKAKAYDESLLRAKEQYNIYSSEQYDIHSSPVLLEYLFPVLKESRDKKIRKCLIILLKHFCNGYRISGLDFPVSYKDMLAWIEKQDEQKSSNKIESKFKAKELKKVEQESDGWSEEDEKMLDYAICMISWYSGTNESKANSVINWITSLKDRAQSQPKQEWKPTGAQLASLEIACDRNDRIGFDLTQLFKELKKLV